MILKQISLKNFGLFKRRDIDFDNSVSVLYGPNFSGKTTIARGIFHSICGEILTSGLKSVDLTNEGYGNFTSGIIFNHLGSTYRLYRSSKGDDLIEIYDGQNWIQIERQDNIFPRLTSEQLRMGCFLTENELGEFLTRKNASRRDLLNHLLGIDTLLNAQKVAVEVRKISKRKAKSSKSKQLNLRVDEYKDCKTEIEQFRKKVILLEEKLIRPTNKTQDRELYEELKRQKSKSNERVSVLLDKKIENLAGFNDVDELKQTLIEIRSKIGSKADYSTKYETIKESRITRQTKLNQINETLDQFSNIEGQDTCPICMQNLPENHVTELKRNYMRMYNDQKAEMIEIEKEEGELKETLDIIDQLSEKEFDLANRSKITEDTENEISELLQEIERIDIKLASADSSETENEDRLEYEKALEDAKVELSKFEMQQAMFEKNQKILDDTNKIAIKASQDQIACEWFADAFAETIRSKVGSSLKQVEKTVFDCLHEFNIFNSDVSDLDLEKTNLLPKMAGRPFHALSGGEKSILYIGMKLAISELMPGADFMVMDNPSLHLDYHHKTIMADYLVNLAKDKQLIILTNDKNFADKINTGNRLDL